MDGLEVGFDFAVKLDIAVAGDVFAGGYVGLDALEGEGFGANAFDDAPGGIDGYGLIDDGVDLVGFAEGAERDRDGAPLRWCIPIPESS